VDIPELTIVDEYPSEAAGQCDFFSMAAPGDILVDTPDGQVLRREKVIITPHYLDYEGRICVGERTIRHLAHKFRMVDDWRVNLIARDNDALRAELVELSTELANTRAQVEFLRALETAGPSTRYIATDGSVHASERAAQEASRAVPPAEQMLAPVRDPEPEGAQS
jgi:hypothetical protein